MNRRSLLLGFVLVLAPTSLLHAAAGGGGALVLTALPATYGVTSALAQGTRIRVENVPADGRPPGALARYLEKPPEAVLTLLRSADAVVTVGKLWHEDPLYAVARAHNLRVVNIDATEPYSATLPGIALVRDPSGVAPWDPSRAAQAPVGGASVYFWLSLSNAARMADIVAGDLMRLAPEDAVRIAQNLAAFRRTMFDLKNVYEARLAALDDVTLFALTPDLAYFTGDLGLFVDGYFSRQDIEWSPADLAAFGKYLQQRHIKVVLHRWEPSPAIQQAITAAGAKLLVLRIADTAEATDGRIAPSAYSDDLKWNLDAVLTALGGQKAR
jgi:ABC-type Zn uptake system ZnuABC Zn-binding protein ZnuA